MPESEGKKHFSLDTFSCSSTGLYKYLLQRHCHAQRTCTQRTVYRYHTTATITAPRKSPRTSSTLRSHGHGVFSTPIWAGYTQATEDHTIWVIFWCLLIPLLQTSTSTWCIQTWTWVCTIHPSPISSPPTSWHHQLSLPSLPLGTGKGQHHRRLLWHHHRHAAFPPVGTRHW